MLPCDPGDGEGPQGPSWSEHDGCICGSWVSQTKSDSFLQQTASLRTHETHTRTGCCSGTVQVLNQTAQRAAAVTHRPLLSQQQVNVSARLSALHS